jgi:hypothetical protein
VVKGEVVEMNNDQKNHGECFSNQKGSWEIDTTARHFNSGRKRVCSTLALWVRDSFTQCPNVLTKKRIGS